MLDGFVRGVAAAEHEDGAVLGRQMRPEAFARRDHARQVAPRVARQTVLEKLAI